MRKWLGVALCLLLVSCVDVDDFGMMWEKGAIDPRLEGTWLVGDGKKAPDIKSDKWRLTRQETGYHVKMLRTTDDETVQTLRTLVWKDYTYLMLKEEGRPNGSMIRYEMVDGRVDIFGVDQTATEAWFAQKYPGTKNLRIVKSEYFHGLKVMLLDPSSMDALSDLPREYWKKVGEFVRFQ